MDPQMANFMALLFIGWLLFLAFYIPKIMMKRAVLQVIKIFRKSSSLCSQSPKGVEELGLQDPDFVDRLFKPRDYKPYALKALIMAGAVRENHDGRVCLLENKVPEVLGRE